MKENFERAFAFVIEQEGGNYEEDPDDPGGATKFGICKRDHPGVDIENLTLDGAKQIYRDQYWVPSGCDRISNSWDFLVFDTAVNCGVDRAKRMFQESDSLAEFALNRIDYYASLKKLFPKYGRGWVLRTMRCYRRAL